MARRKSTLNVSVAPRAAADLAEIWRWNAEHYGPDHADVYLGFLKKVIYGLGRSYSQGKTISARTDLQYVLVRRKAKGHGHLAVYRFDNKQVEVLHVFHTAQDWQSKLADERLDEG